MERFGFADVLGLDRMVADLVERRPAAWIEYIGARRPACDRLFDPIAGQP